MKVSQALAISMIAVPTTLSPRPSSRWTRGRELPPAVVVGVEEERLEEEEQDVGQEGRREDAHQVGGELRVEDDQHEGQEGAEGAGERERHRQQLGELVGQLVVALVLGPVADELDDQREDRHREHEGGEQQVELGHDPDRDAAADLGERPVLGLDVRLARRRLLLLGRGLVGDALLARRRPPTGVGGAVRARGTRGRRSSVDDRRRTAAKRDERRDDRARTARFVRAALSERRRALPARRRLAPARRCCSSRTWAMIAQRSAGGIG